MKHWRLGLIGRDIGHSPTPSLHRTMLAMTGLAGESRLLNGADLRETVLALRNGELDGLCVTTPHKLDAAALAEIWADGLRCEAANTLWMNGSQLCAASTDGPGLAAVLAAHGVPLGTGLPVWLLGSGGASTAIAQQLVSLGCSVSISGRSLDNFGPHCRALGCLPLPWGRVCPDAAVVIHVSRWGHGRDDAPDLSDATWDWLPWSDWRHRSPWLGDIVYRSQGPTWFEDLAVQSGVAARAPGSAQPGLIAGLGMQMLAAQAAVSFAWWTGREVAWPALLPTLAARPTTNT